MKKCYICDKRIIIRLSKSIHCRGVGDHCHYADKYRGAAHSICNLKVNVPNEILVVFHNGSNYDYHFIMKELANESERQFECLWGRNGKVQKFFRSNRKRKYKHR